MSENKTIYEKLLYIQQKLKSPKDLINKFGGYTYRSTESILQNAKPFCAEMGVVILLDDDVELIGDRYYVKATATLTDGINSVSTHAFAREAVEKKGMDDSQITGSTSSYARKYALNGLLAIDDTKDADSMDNSKDGIKKPIQKETRAVTPAPNLNISKELQEEAKELKIDFAKVATYKKKNIADLTDDDARSAIDMKKKALKGVRR